MIFSQTGKLMLFSALLIVVAFSSAAGDNLLLNASFEEPLKPVWEKRTPENAQRKLYREEGVGRKGAAVVLENIEPSYTRLRQGHDRSINIAAGSRIELSALIKSEQDTNGVVKLQIYCMDAKGGILSQPTSRQAFGAFDWTRHRVLAIVPQNTAYVMAYLQTKDGVGRVLFDDVELCVKCPPVKRPPASRIALLSDLSDDHPVIQRARTLFEDGLTRVEPDQIENLKKATGALVLYDGAVPASVPAALDAFTRNGGCVFMDIRAFACSHGTKAVSVNVGPAKAKSLKERMTAGLRVVRVFDATAGFTKNQIMPRAGLPDGNLFVLPKEFSLPGMDVLAVAPGGEAGLVRVTMGKGSVTACDLLSLREPYCRSMDAYYAFTPVSGALGNPVRFGQYYPERMTYAGVVAEMKRLAEKYPAIEIKEEGIASNNDPIYTLNLGTPGKPLYFLYAATHGSEWEPGYGLMTFAWQIAEGNLSDVVDLNKVQIKILPILNPSGYSRMRRQNAHGVDLNRQGDHQWERYQGRDSNKNGKYGPNDYDWKGSAPLSEPEAQVYHKIAMLPNLYCLLDYHSNSGAKSNKLGILPAVGHPENELMAFEMQEIVNARLRGRHLLRQNQEDTPSQYLLDNVIMGSDTPFLMNTGARNKFGILVELTGIYRESYGTLLQTDVTCEICRALFLADPPPVTTK
ncbi:MAG: M14 family zinc carboxypeptidase [Kiritimatiellae bacterium]|jgi:hypothetical protein|nr:M14 family zinc carboxypeptidase [Kiritimatiellia bacterium]